jgi:cyclophilin family peptidyl-prolyl cis-trans isomerase
VNKLALWILAACALAGACLAVGQAGAGKGLTKTRAAFKLRAGQTVLELTIQKRGEVYIDLDTKNAPKTTAQIISLAQSGFYNGQKFFKVLKSPRPYLVQTGDPLSRTEPMESDKLGNGGSGTMIPYEETHQEYYAGRVVLATLDGDPNTGDSQFYILLGDYDNLLKGTGTVFGRVILGMDVVNRIELGDQIVTATILSG